MNRWELLRAAGVAALVLTVQGWVNWAWLTGYDSEVLPAFDAYPYVAMAENPAFFTVAPHGYRVLTPWLVALVPGDVGRGFRVVTFGALGLAMLLLFLYLRQLEHGEWPSLLAVAAFGLSPQVDTLVEYLFLTDPLAVMCEVALLLALSLETGTGVLALLLVLGSLSREAFVLFIPLVYLARRQRGVSRTRSLADMAMAALPACTAVLLLRLWWTPHLRPPAAMFPDLLVVGWARFHNTLRDWWLESLLWGLTPLALLGALRKRARAYLPGAGYVALVALVTPFLNPDLPRGSTHLAGEMRRYLVYVLPVLFPLALWAMDGVWPHAAATRRGRSLVRGDRAAWAIAFLLAVAPVAALDRYRRLDLRGPRDGPLVLAFCRGSRAMATRLARGRTVVLDPDRDYFVAGRSDPHDLGRMRWYLREGWGHRPSDSAGEVLMRTSRASLVLPCLRPEDLSVRLWMTAAHDVPLRLEVNGRDIGSVVAGPVLSGQHTEVPGSVLFRGDNALTLVLPDGDHPPVRLHRIFVRALRAPNEEAH